MIVSVLMYARIDKHPPGSVAEYENGPHVHRLLRSGKVGLVDPPSLDMIEGFYGNGKHLPSEPEPVYERPSPGTTEGSGEASEKRPSRRNRARSSGPIGEDGSGPSSGPAEGLTDDRIHHGQREESSESLLDS